MKLGGLDISTVKLGASQVQAVYKGDNLVWQNAPVATAATGIGQTSFTANWNAYTGAFYYLLDVSEVSDFSTFVYENQIVEAPNTSYVVIGLNSNTTYYYRVRASTDELLLLNEYPNAAAAYSLRRINGSYTGDAIRVRRALDNTEQDIGFVNNELDTSTLETFCSGTDGFVKTWYDQSGNGYDATQTTAANQPQIVSSGSVLITNGKPSVQFDGLDSFNLSSISVNSFFMVNKLNVIGSVNYAMWEQSDIKGFFLGGNFSGIDGLGLYDGAVKSSSIGENTNQNLIYFNHNSSNYDIGLNSSSLVSLSSSTTININTIGRNQSGLSINGNNQEIIIYPSNQSSNRTGIETNINANYQIYWDGSQTSLLDTYSGSAAAYSLRALSSAYTGPLVRVRRASDNAEQDIYAKYDGTLNVSALESFCSGTDGFVKTWYDQSGNARDATQTTAANQPQIVSSGSVILENGKPGLNFDGTNDSFQTTSVVLNQPLTLFNVNKYNILNVQVFISLSSTLSIYASALVNSNFRIFYGSYLIGASRDTNRHLFYSLANSSNSEIAIDGSSAIIGNAGTRNGSVIDIGYSSRDGSYANTVAQEIIIYSSDQSSNRTGIETNINDFYSIY